ncbi:MULTISPECIES: tRNA glutamyl-Q(34) synthetase GluQRS [Synechococcales]|uniref:tRNA glutamyl-Q(34) synthetase GluQRS n=1 Tax=Synechococcus sp. CS-1324 TaxID=2847980 RepID=UPI0037D9ABD0
MPAAANLSGTLLQALEQGERLRRSKRRGRFAPSPSGLLHAGNLRTALLSWLQARLSQGEWLLRFDDLDTPRNRSGAEEAIQADLSWLGLGWDGPPIRQSERQGLYLEALELLRQQGRLYPCHCSRRVLGDVSAPHGAWPIYPGTCRQLPPDWAPRRSRHPSWRLRLSQGDLRWPERLAAEGVLDAATAVGDVVLRRADGFVAYHLATAVDELTLGISTVLRGADLWHSSAPQVAVMAGLGPFPPPDYWHVPLWRQEGGRRLSKRDGSEGLQALRDQGLDAAAVIGRLASSLELVPAGSRLSAQELRQQLSEAALRQALSSGQRPESPSAGNS